MLKTATRAGVRAVAPTSSAENQGALVFKIIKCDSWSAHFRVPMCEVQTAKRTSSIPSAWMGLYFDISTVYGGVRLKPAIFNIDYILCTLISAKSMVGLDSIRFNLLLYTMCFYSWLWILVYGGSGRLATVKWYITIYYFLIVTGRYRLLMLIHNFLVTINFSLSSKSTGHLVILCISGSTASNCFQT